MFGSASSCGTGPIIWVSSAPVRTAETPGSASAADPSTDSSRACATGAGTTAMCSMPGRFTSLMYLPPPRTKRLSSITGMGLPMNL